MKKIAIIFILAAMVGCNDAANNEAANTPKTDTALAAPVAKAPAPPMDQETMMKKMMEYGTPGEMHKLLASLDGKWTTENTMWMNPDSPSQTSMGTCENKMVLGGRYQQSVHTGNMGGMPFEGMGTVAYDNSKKVFISTWIDNMGTGIMTVEGPYDATTKTISMKGTCVDCTTGKNCEIRENFKIIDDKNLFMDMYVTPAGGKEYKTMEIKFAKK